MSGKSGPLLGLVFGHTRCLREKRNIDVVIAPRPGRINHRLGHSRGAPKGDYVGRIVSASFPYPILLRAINSAVSGN